MAKLHPISKACNDPQRKADVVFIHGLGGDAFGTWRHDKGDDTSWPHWLAEAFPDVGVWSLGHAADPSKPLGLLAKLVGKGGRDAGQGMSLPDRAVQVLDGMRLDKLFRGERPIVFVCHSLGGLLAKQILRQAHDNAGNADPESISRRTAAVLFLATPHNGADLATLIDNFSAIFGPTASLIALKAHDPHLRNLYNWYRNHAPKLGIATETYFEGRDRLGFRIVDETSSQPGVGPDAVMLDEDHLSIAKPRERDAQVCLALEALLRDVIARATASADRGATIVGNLAVTKATDSPETESRASLHTRIAPPSSPIPPNLRLADYGFFGRTEQQARLLQRLRAGQTTAVVGGPGLGKTALVAKVLRTLLGDTEAAQRQALAGLPFPDGIVFLDLYALHGQADQAWEALASAVAPQTPDDAGATRTMPARERAIAACRGKRFLLVVEGGEEARGTAEPGDYARTTRHALLDPLALQGPVLWLTRSAAQSNANEWVRIDTTLDIDDARELFDAIAGTDVPRTVRDEALEALHGHPLAITWVAALIAREDEPPDLLLADLRQQPSLLQLQDPERPHHTLQWLFDRSLRGLDADARRSLLAAGLLAADAFPLEAIAAGTGLDDRAQREALRACVQAHLLRWQTDESGVAVWRFGHALAYGYACEQGRVEPDTAAALLRGLAGWAHVTLKAGLAVHAPPEATAAVSRTLAHALALLAVDTPPRLWWPLVEDLLYDFGDRFKVLGQLTRALAAREAVARWLAQAQAAQPQAAEWLRESATCHTRLGDLDLVQGDLPRAQQHHAAALAIAERLAAQDPANAEWQRDLSVSHNKLGEVQQDQGDLPGAQGHYAAASAIAERLAAQDPANAGWQRDLSISHERLGEVQQAQGDLPGAQRHYETVLSIRERLAAQDPANAGLQRDLSVSHNNLGDVQQAGGDLLGAQRLTPRIWPSPNALPRRIRRMPTGNAICVSATSSSAMCCGPRATCPVLSGITLSRWPSSNASPRRIPRMPAGSAIWG
jgi:tetratricopeptide (TPR) repeat protein